MHLQSLVACPFQNLRDLGRKKQRGYPPSRGPFECYHKEPRRCYFSTRSFLEMKEHLVADKDEIKKAYIRRKEDKERTLELLARMRARQEAREREIKERETAEEQTELLHAMGKLGAVAILLALDGLYGKMAHLTTQIVDCGTEDGGVSSKTGHI